MNDDIKEELFRNMMETVNREIDSRADEIKRLVAEEVAKQMKMRITSQVANGIAYQQPENSCGPSHAAADIKEEIVEEIIPFDA
jgi:hypothetical protein